MNGRYITGLSRAKYNESTHTYDTSDGTKVAAELVDSARSLGEVFYINSIREKQRKNRSRPND